MKKILLLLIASLALSTTYSQDRWTIQLNSQTLLTAKKEDTTANLISITDIKKGSLIITYASGKADSKWGRRLAIYDVTDNELYAKEAFSITIPAATLKKWKAIHSQIKVYTWPISKDPRIKLKVRRVHLCTINFT
jgi:hypothetical protein